MPQDFGGTYRNLLTGETIDATTEERGVTVRLAEAFRHCPVALLWRATQT